MLLWMCVDNASWVWMLLKVMIAKKEGEYSVRIDGRALKVTCNFVYVDVMDKNGVCRKEVENRVIHKRKVGGGVINVCQRKV